MESYTSDTEHEGIKWINEKHIGPMDFSGDELASYALNESGGLEKNRPIEIELPQELIENWRKMPELMKAGLVLWMHSEDHDIQPRSRFAYFHSRENSDPPRLIIEY